MWLGAAWVNWTWFVVEILRHRHVEACEAACPVLALRPEVRWLGLPSVVWGGLYYGVLTVVSFLAGSLRRPLLQVLTTAGLVASVWLLYLLRVRLRAHCRGCYIAHGLNLALWLTALQ
jgi:uncharacterized membrane protein